MGECYYEPKLTTDREVAELQLKVYEALGVSPNMRSYLETVGPVRKELDGRWEIWKEMNFPNRKEKENDQN